MPLYLPSAPRKRVAGPLWTSTTSSSVSPKGGTGRSLGSSGLKEGNANSSADAMIASAVTDVAAYCKTARRFIVEGRNRADEGTKETASLVK